MEVRAIAFVVLLVSSGCDGDGAGGDADADMDADSPDGSDGGDLTCETLAEPGGLADCGFDESITFDHSRGTVLQLESADGELCARLERRDDSPFPADSAVLWTLVEARVGRRGSVARVVDSDGLCWRVIHHNWEDAARIWTGTVRYDLDLTTVGGHGGRSTYTLNVYRAGPLDPDDTYCMREGATPLCDPVELYPVNP